MVTSHLAAAGRDQVGQRPGAERQQSLVVGLRTMGRRTGPIELRCRLFMLAVCPHGCSGSDDQGGVGPNLLPQPLHTCQFGRPAAVQELRHLLTAKAARVQTGATELSSNQVTAGAQAARKSRRHRLGVLKSAAGVAAVDHPPQPPAQRDGRRLCGLVG